MIRGTMNLSRAESYLSTFHDANPGATPRAFEALPVRRDGLEFASTYRSLISALPDTEAPLTVLDLACGDGHLLSLLADGSTSPARALIGVDLSAGELGAARSRLGDRAALYCCKAQQPAWAGLDLGDRRLRSVDGIREMLAPGFDRIEFAELNTSRRCTPAQLWDW